MDDNNGLAQTWARISRVLREDSVPPRVAGLFYKAVVQAVLLYGSESWNLTASSLRVLEGFHLRAAYKLCIVNKPRRSHEGQWAYPRTDAVLEEAGLHTIEHYVRVRRDTIASHIATRPIFDLCRRAASRRGTAPRQYWWEQEFNLEEAASDADEASVVAA